MSRDIFEQVSDWYCEGIPEDGLTQEERFEIIGSTQGSYLYEHIQTSPRELDLLSDQDLVRVHYQAMLDAAR